MPASDCFRAASLVNIVVHLLLMMTVISLYSAASLSEAFSGPIDPTGQIDFSDGTACACPGSPVQYLCTVSDPSGNSFTLWRGTAFDCAGNQAILLHSQYTSGSAVDACDSGIFTLSARGLTNVTGNCYTSVLTVNVEPGLNGRTVECTFAGTRTIGNDTLRVAVPLAPPSTPQVDPVIPDQSFTVSWTPPTAECGNAVTYMYPGLAASMTLCGQCTGRSDTPSVTCRGWTAQGQNCSITARADICVGQQGEQSQPVIVTLQVPGVPIITDGAVILDDSVRHLTVSVSWEVVSSTPEIAVSGGQVLVDGSITGYLVSLDSGNNVRVSCSNSTCSTSLTTELPVGRSGFTVSVAAINSLGRGPSDQAACELVGGSHINVTIIGSSALDVTLTCPVAGCTIRYGLDPTYQTLPFEGRSGEPLQDLATKKTYYYEASINISCGVFRFRLRDSFDTYTCEQSSDQLPNDLVAVSVVMTFLLTLFIGLLGMLLVYCIMRRRLQQPHSYHTEPSTTTVPATTTAAAAAAPVYDVVGPGPEKFEMEGNTAYGPVRR